MRILAGKYKGKRLLAGNDLSIRPLTNRLKESIFNILQDLVLDGHALDLFCGSGSFGLEALSRGAGRIEFVEQSKAAIKYLKSNLLNLKIDPDNYIIHHMDAVRFCRFCTESYDLILMDPPFKFHYLQELIEIIANRQLLEKSGLMIIHHEIINPISATSALYKITDQRRYGRSFVSFVTLGEQHVQKNSDIPGNI